MRNLCCRFVLLSLAILAAACGGLEAEPTDSGAMRQLEASRGDLELRLRISGELVANDALPVTVPQTEVWQLQISRLVEDGASVEAGDVIVEFDAGELLQQLEEGRRSLVQAHQSLVQARAQSALDLAAARHALRQAEVALTKARLDADVPAGLLPRRAWQDRQLALAKAAAAWEKARAELAAAEQRTDAEITIQSLVLERTKLALQSAQEGLERLSIRAPRAGSVLLEDHPWFDRPLEVGDPVYPGMQVARMPNFEELAVRARLPDVDAGRVRPGMRGRCVLDAYPNRAHPCVVESVSPMAQPPSGESLRRFFDVRLRLEAKDSAGLLPGMSVRVSLLIGRITDALLAPRIAIGRGGDAPRLYLAGGESIAVRLGPCSARSCVLLEGPAVGTRLRRPPAEEST